MASNCRNILFTFAGERSIRASSMYWNWLLMYQESLMYSMLADYLCRCKHRLVSYEYNEKFQE